MTDVSIVMSVFNSESTLQRAIDSVVAQTLIEWEMIIVDDASTDGSAAIVDQAARRDPRIRVLRNETNLGLAASLNRAWRVCGGTLIARMDADDVSEPTRLEKQREFLMRNSRVDILGTAVTAVCDGREAVARFPEQHEVLVANMGRVVPVVHPTVMMRRTVLEALGGYDDSLRRAQDSDLWFRARGRFRFHNLQEPLLRHNVRPAPSFRSIWMAAFVLGRAAVRDRRIAYCWYAVRALGSGLLVKSGLRPAWPR